MRNGSGDEYSIDLTAFRHVYAQRPLTAAVVAALNPDTTLAALIADLDGIGYPYEGG
jgi:hypothetical protein